MGYKKYGWAANKIDDTDMQKLHQLKEKTSKKITEMVREAVKDYVSKSGV